MRTTRIKNARLAAAMAAKGMTGNELAGICNVHPTTVSALLNLRRDPKPETAEALARALDTVPEDLFPEGGVQ